LLVVCDSEHRLQIERVSQSIGINADQILFYPGIGYIDADKTILIEKIQRVTLKGLKSRMNVMGLLLEDNLIKGVGDVGEKQEINMPFDKVVEAAVGVAMGKIQEKHKEINKEVDHKWQVSDPEAMLGSMFKEMSNAELNELRSCNNEFIIDAKGAVQSFEKISEHVNSALICIVDLIKQDPLSYFWLGYSHARNINIIPVYRDEQVKNIDQEKSSRDLCPLKKSSDTLNSQEPSSLSYRKEDKDHVLAFDIRALWYMRHKVSETKSLAKKLAAVFEPILVRDVATQQRKIFWERLTRNGRVYIYNGAIHHEYLNREVVGDWDLRTASELISYLSSTDESVMPDLMSPIYSPETIAFKMKKELGGDIFKTSDDFIQAYAQLVERQLKGKDCLIVGSSDVNPLTEVILANIYMKRNILEYFKETDLKSEKSSIIAFKGVRMIKSSEEVGSNKTYDLLRRFSRVIGRTDERGFYIDGERHSKKYYSQDDAKQKFEILAHLVIVRNPFSEGNVIVILNGVSGPATYGLAQILTGAGGLRVSESEKLLKDINERWSKRVEGERDKYKGIEAIVSVWVTPHSEKQQEQETALKQNMDNVLFDRRAVGSWDFYKNDKNYIDNPRDIPIR